MVRHGRFLIFAPFLLAACSGSSPAKPAVTNPPSTSTAGEATSSPAALGADYERIVAPVNTAGTALSAKLTPNTNLSDVPGLSAAFVAAVQKANDELLRLPATGQAATDIRTLTQDDSALIADLSSAPSLGDSFLSTYNADNAKTRSASSAVRADLGLPPS